MRLCSYDKTWLKPSVAEHRRKVANSGIWNGRDYTSYFGYCRGFHQSSGTLMILSRDQGHHTSGWWKNPDYERCYHLSLSFHDPVTREKIGRDKKLTREWIGLVFGKDQDKLWCEPPYSPEGKQDETWHYRLFCTPAWTPILPRGEVYGRELTEIGWKSYSDVQADLQEAEAAYLERLERLVNS